MPGFAVVFGANDVHWPASGQCGPGSIGPHGRFGPKSARPEVDGGESLEHGGIAIA